jgi:hypothetical protein
MVPHAASATVFILTAAGLAVSIIGQAAQIHQHKSVPKYIILVGCLLGEYVSGPA